MGLSGKLEDLNLADIFQILSIGKKSGFLLISSGSTTSGLIFKNGLVVWAESDIVSETFKDDLSNAGITDTVDLLLSNSDAGLGLNASEKTHLPENAERVARRRIEKISYKLLLLKEGDFRFEPDAQRPTVSGFPEPIWELRKGLSPEYLIMESARIYDEVKEFGRPLREDEDTGVEDETKGSEDVPSPDSGELGALRALTLELRFPETPSEIALLVLRYASDIFQRAVLFIIHEGHLAGFGQFGLEGEQPDERVREIFLDYRKSGFLKGIIAHKLPYRGTLPEDELTGELVKILGGGWPDLIALYPVIAEGEVVALLYCDNHPARTPIGETPGLEIFINQAGLALEKAMLKKKLSERGEAR
ncbi:MAG: DUF4388 domain-containing protein [Nitrospirae bacterium]|nr:MAG: DUF4388 domain-containing protein [Nitrospirota bacterium]